MFYDLKRLGITPDVYIYIFTIYKNVTSIL
jgi:hypothetical protein